jgi:hypothetical protein
LSEATRRAGKNGCGRRRFTLQFDGASWFFAYARFNDDVNRAAGHNQVLDVIAADQNELSPPIHIGLLDDLDAGLGARFEQQGRRRCTAQVGPGDDGAGNPKSCNDGKDCDPADNVCHATPKNNCSAEMPPRQAPGPIAGLRHTPELTAF